MITSERSPSPMRPSIHFWLIVWLALVFPSALNAQRDGARVPLSTDEQRCEWYYRSAQLQLNEGAALNYEHQWSYCSRDGQELLNILGPFHSQVMGATLLTQDRDTNGLAREVYRLMSSFRMALPVNSPARSFIENTGVVFVDWTEFCRTHRSNARTAEFCRGEMGRLFRLSFMDSDGVIFMDREFFRTDSPAVALQSLAVTLAHELSHSFDREEYPNEPYACQHTRTDAAGLLLLALSGFQLQPEVFARSQMFARLRQVPSLMNEHGVPGRCHNKSRDWFIQNCWQRFQGATLRH